MKKKILVGALALSGVFAISSFGKGEEQSNRKFWGTECHQEEEEEAIYSNKNSSQTKKTTTICCYYVFWINTGCHEEA